MGSEVLYQGKWPTGHVHYQHSEDQSVVKNGMDKARQSLCYRYPSLVGLSNHTNLKSDIQVQLSNSYWIIDRVCLLDSSPSVPHHTATIPLRSWHSFSALLTYYVHLMLHIGHPYDFSFIAHCKILRLG